MLPNPKQDKWGNRAEAANSAFAIAGNIAGAFGQVAGVGKITVSDLIANIGNWKEI